MALAPDISNPETSDLQTVSVVITSHNPATKIWMNALRKNGAEMLDDKDVQSLWQISRQKVAVILDQDVPKDRITEIIQKYEQICQQNPFVSLRFFGLQWDKEISHENDRLRIINIEDDIWPSALPPRINRALFKARLPDFLRKHYSVDISDKLEEINGITYRPVTIRSFIKTWERKWEIDYETENLYIHEKCLYSYIFSAEKNKFEMVKITEEDRVLIKKYDSKIPASLSDLSMLKDETEEE